MSLITDISLHKQAFSFKFGTYFNTKVNYSSSSGFSSNSHSNSNFNFGNSNSDFNYGSNSNSDGFSKFEDLVEKAFSKFSNLFADTAGDLTKEIKRSIKLFDTSVTNLFDILKDTKMNTDKQFLKEACCIKTSLKTAIKNGMKLSKELSNAGDFFLLGH
uniref:Uncharacterized protein n=1 Tax=Strigamia maritima TaxID=126957 RepID=T1IMH4_STRMM